MTECSLRLVPEGMDAVLRGVFDVLCAEETVVAELSGDDSGAVVYYHRTWDAVFVDADRAGTYRCVDVDADVAEFRVGQHDAYVRPDGRVTHMLEVLGRAERITFVPA